MTDRKTREMINELLNRSYNIPYTEISRRTGVAWEEVYRIAHGLDKNWAARRNGRKKTKITEEQVFESQPDYQSNGFINELERRLKVYDDRMRREAEKFVKDIETRLVNVFFTQYSEEDDLYYRPRDKDIFMLEIEFARTLRSVDEGETHIKTLERLANIGVNGTKTSHDLNAIKRIRRKYGITEDPAVKTSREGHDTIDYTLLFFRNPCIFLTVLYKNNKRLASLAAKNAIRFWDRYKIHEEKVKRFTERHQIEEPDETESVGVPETPYEDTFKDIED